MPLPSYQRGTGHTCRVIVVVTVMPQSGDQDRDHGCSASAGLSPVVVVMVAS